MKKRVIIHSVAIWIGASLFLYSYPAFGTTKIYDPMNPSEAITPIPNDDPQETKDTDAQIVYESTDSSEPIETSEASTVDSSTEEAEEAPSSETTNQGDKTQEKDRSKEKQQQRKPSKSDKKWKHIRQPQTPLMLDDDFFNSSPLSMPNPSSGGGTDGDEAFSQVALSAYLLSGVALYGETATVRETKLSDYFA